VAGRQKTEAPITPTADRQPARLGNFTAPLLRKIAAPLTPVDAYLVTDLRCKGLALRVAADGGKTWNLSFRIKGAGVRRVVARPLRGRRPRSSPPASE
jgi:hypothetical protein